MTPATELIRIRRLAESGAAQAIREAAGLSLAEFAAEAGVDKTTIWRWEHGQRRPRGDTARRYLKVLDELVGR